eukprot:CAMPEP_0198273994 /NCGR_PEP_ID=MMETSP1447-20131203/58764_1 /TAXON_ID=420782 /ORGANISM="Chaetoceros dichaeta, Strain CCMP1751" /LENGTH=400 /DNA_ID=CAMNT_0043967921 /DNA_START=38 /DNA_END=1240 /DNA_ORIENTATION=+
MATCAAALLLEDGKTIHSLGGKHVLSSLTTITQQTISSADAEYEGLLLGLNHVLYLCENSLLPLSCDDDNYVDASDGSNGAADGSVVNIIIRGDCKMVIDHLNQYAIPRKQRGYYKKVKGLIHHIQNITAAAGKHPITFKFEHIPRNENVLCDFLCQMLITVMQKKAVEDLRLMTQEAEVNATINLHAGGEEQKEMKLPRSKKKRFMFDKTPFTVPLGYLSIDEGGHIPLHARPALICDIACAAIRVNDPVAMRLTGHIIVQEANLWQRMFKKELTNTCNLQYLGWSLEYAALLRMQLYREADKIGRKIYSDFGEVECGDESQLIFMQVLDELLKVRSLLQLRDTECVNLREVTMPYSKWSSIINDWYYVLSDVFVKPESGYLPKNGWKKLVIEGSVWLL